MKKILGVWLTNVDSQVLNSQQKIIDAINLLADTGFNTVFPVVWNKGFTQYPSQVMRQTFNQEIDPAFHRRDPLAEVIEAAQNVGIDVIPWFEYGFACSFGQNGGHIINSKPQWAAKDKDNNLLKKNGFEWMNAFDAEVQNFMLSLFLEIVHNYNVAGVQGDDRIPALPSEGGYDEKTKTRYRNELGIDPPRHPKDPRWLKWRADILTSFLSQLYREIKAVNNQLLVSMSPSPFPFGYREYLQDYPTWVRRKIVDLIHPQLYRRTLNDYQSLVDVTVSQFNPEDLTLLSPGVLIRIGDFHLSAEQLWQSIVRNRRSGIRGEVLFFFEELMANNQALATFLKSKDYANFIDLRRDRIGDDVEEVQQLLARQGYDIGEPDGIFGTRTELAVKMFQSAHGLDVDGVVGLLTYSKLVRG